jgi:glycolate oxidase FAD binding subunit
MCRVEPMTNGLVCDARPGGEEDAIDGVVPARVVTPSTAGDVAAVLADASRERAATVIRGGGTKMAWGRRPSAVDLVVSMQGLSRVVDHRHGDLVAIVEPGATLAETNRLLAERGQWLPIDAADARATIGGVLAANDSGPVRHRHGAPRDLLIGVSLAMTDGRVVKAGGEVVKNVAGYDLGKLMCGSHGTLAAIVRATFKLAPRPQASETVVARFASIAAAAGAIARLSASQCDPLAFDVAGGAGGMGEPMLLVRVASTPGAVGAQVRAVRGACGAGEVTVVDGETEAAVWADHERSVWTRPGAVVRCAWMPASIDVVLRQLADLESAEGLTVACIGRAGLGTGLVSLAGETEQQVLAVERLRASGVVRHAVVLRAEPEVKRRVDVWGPMGSAAGALHAIKRAFDPANILNAGRGPV